MKTTNFRILVTIKRESHRRRRKRKGRSRSGEGVFLIS
jgi:hypothetical protein